MSFAAGLLAQAVSLGFTAAISPGPFLAYVISQTLSRGWRQTIPLVFAPLLADLPVILLTVFILGQLPDWALRLIQVIGGLFILTLAWSTLRQARGGIHLGAAPAEGPQGRGFFMRGLLMNFLSPGPWIFWSVVNGPIVIRAWGQSPAAALLFVGSFYAVLIGGLAAWVLAFHQARRLDARIVRGLLLLSGIVLLLFGLLLLRSGLMG